MSKFYPILLLVAVALAACNKEHRPPIVTTSVLKTGADLDLYVSGQIYAMGDAEITAKGFCWSNTNTMPDLSSEHSKVDGNSDFFTDTLRDLKPLTAYFVRAYASNRYGTSYGTAERVSTGKAPELPVVQTVELTSVSTNSATITFSISSALPQIIESGIYWNTTGNPNNLSNKLTSSTNSVSSVALNNLEKNTTYYIRSFARTKAGTGYGKLLVFKTYYGTMTDQEGNIYFTTIFNGKEWMAENLRTKTFRDGNAITYVNDNSTWYSFGKSGAYCYFSNNTANQQYGLLYNYYTITSTSSVCPQGWRLPTAADYLALINYFGGSNNASYSLIYPYPGFFADTAQNVNILPFNLRNIGSRNSSGYFYQGTELHWTSSNDGFNAYGLQSYNYYVSMLSYLDFRSGCNIRLIKE